MWYHAKLKILKYWFNSNSQEKKIIFDWEYTKDRYDYLGIDNKKHSYLLDFKVFFK